jgi:phage protein D
MGLGIAIAVNGKPDAELSAAVSVEVEQRAGATTRYRLRYDLAVVDGDFPLLTKDALGPESDLAVIAPLAGKNHYLVKGPVTGSRVHVEHGVGASYVEIDGGDRSVVMDRESKAAVYDDATDSDAVSAILGHYATVTPDVDSTPAMHAERKHALVQRHSDLRFIRWLARRNGFLFWITCDDKGNETAHFKRPPVSDAPVTDLVINLDQNTIENFDITWDTERPSSATGKQLGLNDKSEIDGSLAKSALTAMGKQMLGDIAPATRSTHVAPPVDDAGDLQARAEGALTDAGWFIHATTRTTVDTLKAVLSPQTVVNVRGLGKRFSGKYFVWSVRHAIDASAHTMDVELVRNAWGN